MQGTPGVHEALLRSLSAAPPLPELTIIEGNEEVQYVYLELPDSVPPEATAPGAAITLHGLDSDSPTLQLGDGTVLHGEYEEPLGSIMFFKHVGGEADGQPQRVAYVCHSESKIVFHVQQPGEQ